MGHPQSTFAGTGMKAISLWQPWASAIAYGLKTIETRSWPVGHLSSKIAPPFDLVIHAAKKSKPEVFTTVDLIGPEDFPGSGATNLAAAVDEERQARHEELRELLRRAGCRVEKLPSGCFVAVCRLTDCRKTSRSLSESAEWVNGLSVRERLWGDFSTDRWGWFLSDVSRIAKPIPARGRQGLWEVRLDEEVELVEAPAEKGVSHVPAGVANDPLPPGRGPGKSRPVLPPDERHPRPGGLQALGYLPGFGPDLHEERLQGRAEDRQPDGRKGRRRNGGRK